jgi:hypothetical protein
MQRTQERICTVLPRMRAGNETTRQRMMGDSMPYPVQKAPWHLWPVGIVSLLWNAMGGVDYSMTHLNNAYWLEQFTPEQIAYFNGFPIWATSCWAFGVWGAVAGSILLLLRHRWAVTTFSVSLLGLIGSHFYQFSSKVPGGLNTASGEWFAAVLAALAMGLLWYAIRMRKRGVLR